MPSTLSGCIPLILCYYCACTTITRIVLVNVQPPTCKRFLCRPATYFVYHDVLMCHTHQREAFLAKGKYDEPTDVTITPKPDSTSAAAERTALKDDDKLSPTIVPKKEEKISPKTVPKVETVLSPKPDSPTTSVGLVGQTTATGTGTVKNTRFLVTPTSLSASPTSASANESCYTCGKRAYPLERLELQVGKETRFYHREGSCLRCSKCGCTLTCAALLSVLSLL